MFNVCGYRLRFNNTDTIVPAGDSLCLIVVPMGRSANRKVGARELSGRGLLSHSFDAPATILGLTAESSSV
ncbi:MAG TPA: hypothetical protein VFK06_15280 [Candidatus Angelobacter sp.]|nr:hypothetical protein [Candidatus Angelobacter sp.]